MRRARKAPMGILAGGLALALASALSLVCATPDAFAQSAPPPPPPAPPGATGQPQPAGPPELAPLEPEPAPLAPSPGVPNQQGTWIPTPDGKSYTWVPAGYQPPPEIPYREGKPIPPGYRLEERPRQGAVITGFVLTGVPYGIGLIAAYSSDFVNKSGYLLVPWAGPWLTMGLRDWHDCDATDEDGTSDGALNCSQDVLAFMGLLIDGMIQLAGGITLTIGYAAKKKMLVYQGATLHVVPTRIGTGYGLGAVGTF